MNDLNLHRCAWMDLKKQCENAVTYLSLTTVISSGAQTGV